MELLLKILEKVLVSFLTSVVLFIIAFSSMTGKFPPKKSDLVKVGSILKEIYFKNSETQKMSKNFETIEPSIEQVAELQRLSLRRTEATLELMKILSRFPEGVPSEMLAKRINKINNQLVDAGNELDQVMKEIREFSELNSAGSPVSTHR